MKWEEIKHIRPAVFKRLVGVHKETFEKMVEEIIRIKPPSAHKISGNMRGPKPKLLLPKIS